MATADYEVKVRVGDVEIEVHGAQQGVVEIVKALSELLSGRTAQTRVEPVTETSARPSLRLVDARTFFQEKAPSTQPEAISVASYYLAELAPEAMRSPTINKEQALDVFRQAKYPLPKRTDQVLVNAQAAGYLDRVSSGEYRLSPVGFNLVEHTLGTNVER